jgi:hypothetical protein
MRQWVLSVPYQIRYWLSWDPKLITQILTIIIRVIKQYYRSKAKQRYKISGTQTGAVTLIQRFGSALNLNVHFHLLFIDGVYTKGEKPQFYRIVAPTDEEIRVLVKRMATRIIRFLTRREYLDDSLGADATEHEFPMLASCIGASVNHRIAYGRRSGKRVRRLISGWGALGDKPQSKSARCAAVNGFSLHANVETRYNEKKKMEKLLRYILRPPVALERMEKRVDGTISYKLKHPYSDGTTHVVFSPMELLEKLVALIPRPRAHLVRYHGVLAPNSHIRPKVIRQSERKPSEALNLIPGSREKRISWAKLLRRVFDVDVTVCPICSGNMKILSAILKRENIKRILIYLGVPPDVPPVAPARTRQLVASL